FGEMLISQQFGEHLARVLTGQETDPPAVPKARPELQPDSTWLRGVDAKAFIEHGERLAERDWWLKGVRILCHDLKRLALSDLRLWGLQTSDPNPLELGKAPSLAKLLRREPVRLPIS